MSGVFLVIFSLIFDLSLNLEIASLVRLANSPGTLLSLSPRCWDYRHMPTVFSLLKLQLKADVTWKPDSGPLQEQYVLIQTFCFVYACSCCVSVCALQGWWCLQRVWDAFELGLQAFCLL